MNEKLINAIDDILPQTQCGLCGYGGCRPYAQALVDKNAAINLCPPGGIRTLNALAALLQQDPKPMWDDMLQKSKPPSIAVIREAECIGCTKCIQACPVDAIIGSAKQMHTVITDECTGCELCIAPCPVDCIDMITAMEPDEMLRQQKSQLARQRFRFKEQRLQLQEQVKLTKHQSAKDLRHAAIQESVKRVKTKQSLHESKKN